MSAKRRAARKRTGTRDARARHPADQVSVSEHDGLLIAREPDLFRPGHEAFCRRLANAACREPGVRSVQVCLSSGACRIEFETGQRTASDMADRFAHAVQKALDEGAFTDGPGHDRGWTTLTVFTSEGAASSWETIREGQADLRLRNPILQKDPSLAKQVARGVADIAGVASCRATLWGRDLEVRFNPEATSAVALVPVIEDIFEQALRQELDQATAKEPALPAIVKGPRRLGYMLMAGGSFALTVVGLVIPGVPTVPFLLATSYYLARSSPTLNGMLLRSRFFGPILDDLERWGGLRRINKIKLFALTLTASAVTLIVIGPPMAVLMIIFAIASASLYVVARMPGIPSASRRRSLSAPATAGA